MMGSEGERKEEEERPRCKRRRRGGLRERLINDRMEGEDRGEREGGQREEKEQDN